MLLMDRHSKAVQTSVICVACAIEIRGMLLHSPEEYLLDAPPNAYCNCQNDRFTGYALEQ